MALDVAAVVRSEALNGRRAKQIERESRRAGVLPVHAVTGFFRREASLRIPALRRLLAEDADRNAIVWSMRPDRVDELAATLDWLYGELPEEFVFEALAGGEPTEKRVSRAELLRIVHARRIETRTRYRVPAAAAQPM